MRRTVILTMLLTGMAFSAGLPAKRVAEAQVPVLLQKVEAQRGQALAPEQRQQFSRTAADLRVALLPLQDKFVRTVARIFGLAEGELRAMIPAASTDSIGFDMSVIAQIEARRGRGVTPPELQQIRAADNAKKADMSEIQSRYAVELGRIAGLSKDQIQRLLPAAGI